MPYLQLTTLQYSISSIIYTVSIHLQKMTTLQTANKCDIKRAQKLRPTISLA